jgi:trimeric autotransporter adhesin
MALIDNLINYWKIDEGTGSTTRDIVNTRDDTITNATWSSSGRINNCLNFDGVSDYVTLPNTTGSAAYSANCISINIWFKTSATGYYQYLLAVCGQYVAVRIGTSSNNGILGFTVSGSGSQMVSTGTANQYADGNWHMFTGTYDGTTVRTYIDSVYKNSGTYTMGNTTDYCYISYNNTTQSFRGLLDEVGIWSRCLSQEEITSLYNSGSGLQYPFTAISNPNNSIFTGMEF